MKLTNSFRLFLLLFFLVLYGLSGCGSASAPNGEVPVEPFILDSDGDGSPDAADCEDLQADIFPDAVDILGDRIDQNCSGADRYRTELVLQTDENNDGSPDRIENHRFDAAANEVFTAYDTNGDGSPEEVWNFVFRADGQLEFRSRDSNGDGIVDQTMKNTFDELGNMVLIEQDNNGDGQIDRVQNQDFDTQGNRVEIRTDEGADGTVNMIVRYIYDSEGNEIRFETDSDGNGSIDSVLRYKVVHGLRVRTESDSDNDGHPNSIVTFEYDAAGLLIKTNSDFNADGAVDSVSTIERDARGFPVREASDGMFGSTSLRTYNDQGYLVKLEFEGFPISYREEYFYDAETAVPDAKLEELVLTPPHLREVRVDLGPDGAIDGTRKYLQKYSE